MLDSKSHSSFAETNSRPLARTYDPSLNQFEFLLWVAVLCPIPLGKIPGHNGANVPGVKQQDCSTGFALLADNCLPNEVHCIFASSTCSRGTRRRQLSPERLICGNRNDLDHDRSAVDQEARVFPTVISAAWPVLHAITALAQCSDKHIDSVTLGTATSHQWLR
jgi:hypothetical protein